jgi:hypothetical protein
VTLETPDPRPYGAQNPSRSVRTQALPPTLHRTASMTDYGQDEPDTIVIRVLRARLLTPPVKFASRARGIRHRTALHVLWRSSRSESYIAAGSTVWLMTSLAAFASRRELGRPNSRRVEHVHFRAPVASVGCDGDKHRML